MQITVEDREIVKMAAALGNLAGVLAAEDIRRIDAEPNNPKREKWERQLAKGLQKLKQ